MLKQKEEVDRVVEEEGMGMEVEVGVVRQEPMVPEVESMTMEMVTRTMTMASMTRVSPFFSGIFSDIGSGFGVSFSLECMHICNNL